MAQRKAKKWEPSVPIARSLKDSDATISEIMFDKKGFEYLNLDDRLLRGLARSGFNKLSFIQKEAIPLGRIGVDMMIKARSGSGKTCAFTCIAYDSLVTSDSAQVLIVAPTREIAFQACYVFRSIGQFYEDVKVCLVTGGFSVGADVKDLAKSQIVVGTPGRLIQLIELNHLNTASMRLVILDEADKLFDNQMRDQMAALLARLPESKQVIAVSATFRNDIKEQIEKYLKDPVVISPDDESRFPKRNAQFTCIVPSRTNYDLKLEIIRKWINNLTFNQMIIFVNTKESGERIANDFKNSRYNCIYVFGNLESTVRFDIFKKFHDHQYSVLVTTDLFARGVDFKNVNTVINFDMPENIDTFLHRVGRAGRFGIDCLTLTLIDNGQEEVLFSKFEKELGFVSHRMPEDMYRDNPWTVLDERYRRSDLTEIQRIDRMINFRRFRLPCPIWQPDPLNPRLQINPMPPRKLKPGREHRHRFYKKRGIYLTKPKFKQECSDGREFLPENSGELPGTTRLALRELYPPECFRDYDEYLSSSEEESEEMPPDGWPGCCGGHIRPGTNRWFSLDEEGKPIEHFTRKFNTRT